MKPFTQAILLLTYILAVFAMSIDPVKPWDCPKNEVYYKCSLEKCTTTCKDLTIRKPCPALSSDCIAPACLCDGELLRNDDGVCVSHSECHNKSLSSSDDKIILK